MLKRTINLHETQRNTKTLQILRLQILQEKICKCLDIQLTGKYVTGSCIPLTAPISHPPGGRKHIRWIYITAQRGPTHKHGIFQTYEMDRFGCKKMYDHQHHHLKKNTCCKRLYFALLLFNGGGFENKTQTNTLNHLSYTLLAASLKVQRRQTQE